MPIEQMNISLPPQMAKFIRSKVKAGRYTDASEVVRDAVRHMQEAEDDKKARLLDSDLEASLTARERVDIRERVQKGVDDLKEGRFEAFDEEGIERYFAGIGERGKKRLAAVGKLQMK
jgi:putative addiction module CopG family antidote